MDPLINNNNLEIPSKSSSFNFNFKTIFLFVILICACCLLSIGYNFQINKLYEKYKNVKDDAIIKEYQYLINLP